MSMMATTSMRAGCVILALSGLLAGCGKVKDPTACSGSETSCSGACIDTRSDPDHCGGCGLACDPGQACMAGQCVLQCNGGTTACSNACVNTASDPANCGGCGNV